MSEGGVQQGEGGEAVNSSTLGCMGGSTHGGQPSWHTPMIALVMTEAIVMSFTCAVGLVANTLVMCLVLSSWSRLQLSARYVLNRALADILFLITIAFDAPMHMQGSWTLGSFLCKLRSALAVVGPLVSSTQLTALTTNCFLGECKPSVPLKERSALLKTMSLVAWTTSLVFGIPTFLHSEILKEVTREHFHCVSLPLSEDRTASQVLRCAFISLVFVVPLVTNWAFIIKIFCNKSKSLIPEIQVLSNAIKPDVRYPWRLPVTFLMVFTMCQVPYWMPYLLREMVRDADFSDAALLIFPAMSAALNPILCLYYIKDLRKTEEGNGDNEEVGETISLASFSSPGQHHHTSCLSLK